MREMRESEGSPQKSGDELSGIDLIQDSTENTSKASYEIEGLPISNLDIFSTEEFSNFLELGMCDFGSSLFLDSVSGLAGPMAEGGSPATHWDNSPQEFSFLQNDDPDLDIQVSHATGESSDLGVSQNQSLAGTDACLQGDRQPFVHPQLRDTDTLLTQFYFHETARIYSVYDGTMNPFRAWVGRAWSHSRLIFCAMQSMAAANLERFYPLIVPIGQKLRKEASLILARSTDCQKETLLALLMVGATSSWFNPKDSGASLFLSFQSRLKRAILLNSVDVNGSEGLFYMGSLVYWRMLLSYVHDHPRIVRDEIGIPVRVPSQPSTLSFNNTPHPWAGVGFEIQKILCEVGLLIRAKRRETRSLGNESDPNFFDSQNSLLEAFELESRLLQTACPTEDQISNTGDQRTPVNHLLAFAEVYRLLGLLQIYRIFPTVLTSRLAEDESTWTSTTRRIFHTVHNHAIIWGLQIDLLQDHHSSSLLAIWLTLFSYSIIEKLKVLPIEAGTGAFQPFLLVACSGELRRPSLHTNALQAQIHSNRSLILMETGILRARQMILGRLQMLRDFLPPKPWDLCVNIVQEVWSRMDSLSFPSMANEESDSGMDNMPFWLDVMIDHGYETLMG
ncbi:hypothetical protein N7493_001779 [Penicillium malachiteum]|uniref:Transcription factor domain-containing protein n=1 Tax=Penicillium malachiteum TaxID=1324776 RepID=A0AAD6HVD6_9EURO|nr:hypothetical protein N7493_001779 [Penicillium malachiteum]